MEIKQFLFLFRKWFLLLALGGFLGGAAAFLFSIRQQEIYQTSTKVMIQSSADALGGYSAYYDDVQRIKNYLELFTTEPILQTLSDRLGFKVTGGITAKQIKDSQIVEITVSSTDPKRAAEIANTLIDVFIEYNTNMQTQRYAESEQNLQAQIQQVYGQITTIQSEMTNASQQSLETQKTDSQAHITDLESQIKTLQAEIDSMTVYLTKLETSAPTAVPGAGAITPEPVGTVNAVQVASVKEQKELLTQKENELGNLQSQLDLYKQALLNLTVYGQSGQNTSDPAANQNAQQSQLQATLALYQQIYSNLLNNYENVRLARLRSTPNITQIEKASIPLSPVSPRPLRNAAMGVAVGILIMGVVAFLIEYLDDTLKTPEDVTGALGVPVIGLIGEMESAGRNKKKQVDSVFVAENPRSPIAEAFRSLRTNLEFAGVDKPLHTLLVTSSEPSEGKTTVAVNLAATLAQGEKKVVLIDADMRRPAVHRYLQIPNKSGLTDIFRHPDELNSAITTWEKLPLMAITSGGLPPNPAELLSSERMGQILNELKGMADIVIVDGPPFILSDPVVLSAKVDGVLIVIRPGETKIGAAQGMIEQLSRAGARVVGAVMNPITRQTSRYYSGKYHYYSQYYARGHDYYSGEGSSSGGKKRNHTEKTKPVDEFKQSEI
jgi:polysaccharide biosynthesis transport protein